jgi:hypothetical protein
MIPVPYAVGYPKSVPRILQPCRRDQRLLGLGSRGRPRSLSSGRYDAASWVSGSAEALLDQADEKSWVKNWIAAEPHTDKQNLESFGSMSRRRLCTHTSAKFPPLSESPHPLASGVGSDVMKPTAAPIRRYDYLAYPCIDFNPCVLRNDEGAGTRTRNPPSTYP